MNGEADGTPRDWGMAASAIVHVLLAALVIFGLPSLPPSPPEPEAIAVTLEPPPEPKPPPDDPSEETPAPAEAEQPPAHPEAAAPLPTLTPVVRFGEEDAGPREAPDGNADADDPAEPEPPQDAEAAEPQQSEPPATTTAETVSGDAQEAPPAPAEPEPAERGAEPLLATAGERAGQPPIPATTTAIPTPRPSRAARQDQPAQLREVRNLLSRTANAAPTATTAMANVPRGRRVGQLCATELRLQLLAAAYLPDLLPFYELDEGTLISIRNTNFRAGGTWYSLGFECQVDSDATQVESFAFQVGDRLTEAAARRLGLPPR
jgi:hypothetical protein